jgi:hypothetical protein
MNARRRWLAGLAGLLLTLFVAGTVLGYAGEVAASVTVSRPNGTLKCGVKIKVRATVLDASAKPIADQPVIWSFTSTPTSADKILDRRTRTNANGVAKTKVVLACVPGSRRLRAQADDVFGSAILNVTAAGLPRTSTLPVEAPIRSDLQMLGTLLALLALAAGGGFALRQILVFRR